METTAEKETWSVLKCISDIVGYRSKVKFYEFICRCTWCSNEMVLRSGPELRACDRSFYLLLKDRSFAGHDMGAEKLHQDGSHDAGAQPHQDPPLR